MASSTLRAVDGAPTPTVEGRERGYAPSGSPATATTRAWWLRPLVWLVAIVLGLLQAWVFRHEVGGDGVNYLDMGEAYLQGDWPTAVNGVWSPLFSWVLAVGLAVLKPESSWQYTVVHLINFGIYLGALASFEFFLFRLVEYSSGFATATTSFYGQNWPWLAIGYTLFLGASLDMIGLAWVNPDMGVSALTYLTAGLLIAIASHRASRGTFLVLGVVLGLGYLTKTILLPLAALYLGIGFALQRDMRQGARRIGLALVPLLILAAPLVIALSVRSGRLTIGDSGRLNYAWAVNGVPSRHWQGLPAGSGTPRHPTRQVVQVPATFEFGEPVGGTYPMWYDPSYWYEGVELHFDVRQQLVALFNNARYIAASLIDLNAAFLIGVFLVLWMDRRPLSRLARDLGRRWFLLLPSLAVLGLYGVVHVERRYLAGFVVVLCLSVITMVQVNGPAASRRLMTGLALVVGAWFLCPVGPTAKPRYYSRIAELWNPSTNPNRHAEVADGLRRLGLSPGDPIASLSYSNFGLSEAARLAKLRIVAEVYYRSDQPATWTNDFWRSAPDRRAAVMQAFGRAGAKGVVSDRIPPDSLGSGWRRVGKTSYSAYLLSAAGVRAENK
jgi:hypothetical protein